MELFFVHFINIIYSIYYYKKVDKDTKKTVLEIDFLIRRENKVIPIEVKSSSAESISSIKKFKDMFNTKVGLQYVLYDGNIKHDGELLYLPYFMASMV